jgi:hypothetical protein
VNPLSQNNFQSELCFEDEKQSKGKYMSVWLRNKEKANPFGKTSSVPNSSSVDRQIC